MQRKLKLLNTVLTKLHFTHGSGNSVVLVLRQSKNFASKGSDERHFCLASQVGAFLEFENFLEIRFSVFHLLLP